MSNSVYEDASIEMRDRLRRIETKVSRLLAASEADQGVNLDYECEHKGGWQLTFKSASVTLFQVCEVLTIECIPVGEMVAVYDRGRYMLTVTVEA